MSKNFLTFAAETNAFNPKTHPKETEKMNTQIYSLRSLLCSPRGEAHSLRPRTLITALAVVLMALGQVRAQGLTGRIYTNPNIMAEEINNMLKDADTAVRQKRDEFYEKARQKKGRELTAKEKQEVEAQVEKGIQMMNAIRGGVKTDVTVEFTSEREVTTKVKMEVKEEVLKAAGVNWAKRKAIKMALAVAPTQQKGTYTLSGNQIIVTDKDDPNEKDTLRLSEDGKKLFGKLDEKKKFVLTRTQ